MLALVEQFKTADKRLKYGLAAAVALGVLVLLGRSRRGDTQTAGNSFADFFVNFSQAAFAHSTAASLGIPADRFYAVMSAESGNAPYSNVGQVVIRFEPHVFARRAGGAAVLLPGMTEPTNEDGRRRRGGQGDEWAAFTRAWAINPEAAAASTSYGVGQIMGFNAKLVGYPSAVAMYADVTQDPMAQFRVFVNFIRNSPKVMAALAAGDYARFVRFYNGAAVGTAKNDGYVARMLTAAEKFKANRVA